MIPWLGAPPAARPKLLVVDDNAQLGQAVMRVMKTVEVEVMVTSDPHQVVALASQWQPDVILLDVLLPEVEGTTLVAQLRREADLSTTRVVLYSALDERDLRRRALACGADDYIAKAHGPVQLRQQLLEWLVCAKAERSQPRAAAR